jgi:sigma-B regulation protein RsbU (phosphoserine phosphatase)
MIAIGDAPSLGLKSAFAARFIGNLFRQLAEREHIEDLGQLIARINATVSQHEYFRRISLQCIAVDPPRDRINIANAGHPYPVHYSARRGECDILPVRGDLLHDYIVRPGELPTWHQYRLEVEPGDIIILVSDGLTEGHILQGDPYEYRFTGVVEKHRNDGPAVIGEAILDDWKAHLREEDSADDVTVVVVVLERARTAR